MANQQQQKPTVHGPIQSVPCPWCGKRNDFRDLKSGFQQQGMMDTQDEATCDHCGGVMEIHSITEVTIIHVTQGSAGPNPNRARPVQNRPQQRGTQQRAPQRAGGGIVAGLQKLLGRR